MIGTQCVAWGACTAVGHCADFSGHMVNKQLCRTGKLCILCGGNGNIPIHLSISRTASRYRVSIISEPPSAEELMRIKKQKIHPLHVQEMDLIFLALSCSSSPSKSKFSLVIRRDLVFATSETLPGADFAFMQTCVRRASACFYCNVIRSESHCEKQRDVAIHNTLWGTDSHGCCAASE